MQGDRVAGLDRGEQVLVVGDGQLGVVPALEHDLGGAPVQGLLHPLEDLLRGAPVALLVPREAVEGAEGALDDADVGVVDVAVDDEGGVALGEAPPADGVRDLADALQVAVLAGGRGRPPRRCAPRRGAAQDLALERAGLAPATRGRRRPPSDCSRGHRRSRVAGAPGACRRPPSDLLRRENRPGQSIVYVAGPPPAPCRHASGSPGGAGLVRCGRRPAGSPARRQRKPPPGERVAGGLAEGRAQRGQRGRRRKGGMSRLSVCVWLDDPLRSSGAGVVGAGRGRGSYGSEGVVSRVSR